ncbi:MAG: hypothetical protein K8R88_00815 [Armatimonadetes bacterium]|nr:hypothetical protein [Armatimonadota bacterium]
MAQVCLEVLLTAWGEVKTIAEWARDSRATGDAAVIAKRLESGNQPEWAIGFDPRVHNAVIRSFRKDEYYAFGDVMTLTDWAEDERCKVSLPTLRKRIAAGWDVEKSLSEPSRGTGPSEKVREVWVGPVTIFGETKSVTSWGNDPRASVCHLTLGRRLAAGWEPERALTEPGIKRQTLEAFGEVMTLQDWVLDPRCQIGIVGLRGRLKAGVDPETAIMTPPLSVSNPKLGKRGSCEKVEWNGRKLFLSEWSRLPECQVTEHAFRERVAKGWSIGKALSTPRRQTKVEPRTRHRAYDYREFTAFGETKPLYKWMKDSRCVVKQSTVRERMRLGYDLETALSTPTSGLKFGEVLPLYEAFGEKKTLPEWGKDPRCVVFYQTLQKRVRCGQSVEHAMTNRYFLGQSMITAFGETKSARDWAEDRRGVASAKTIKQRIRLGVAPELAITCGPKDPRIEYSYPKGKPKKAA